MKKVYLTLFAIIRNEEHYIKEWLAFHRVVGVERFVLILHRCEDRTEEKIRELHFRDDIIIHKIVDDHGGESQMGAYRWCFEHYGDSTVWAMVIDGDEFMYGSRENDLKLVLQDYEEFGGLAVHWHHFGVGQNVLRPSRRDLLAVEAFVHRQPNCYYKNRGFKTIQKADCFQRVISPHVQLSSKPIVREHYDPIGNAYWQVLKEPTWDIVRCDHHYTRSMEDWVARSIRGSCNAFREQDNFYDVTEFLDKALGTVHDGSKLRFLDALKTELKQV